MLNTLVDNNCAEWLTTFQRKFRLSKLTLYKLLKFEYILNWTELNLPTEVTQKLHNSYTNTYLFLQ